MDEKKTKGFLTWWIWCTYAALLAVGIPWYWPRDDMRVVLGVPIWVIVALGCSVVISTFTVVLLSRRWPDFPESDDEEGRP